MHFEPSFMPKQNTKDDAIQKPDISDDESDADFDDADTDYDSDTSDEDWVPDEDEVESDDENPVNYPKSEINWLKETEELYKESKSIVFDCQLKKLFQRCQSCSAHVKFASLKQRGSLICVTSSCVGVTQKIGFLNHLQREQQQEILFYVAEFYKLGITSLPPVHS